MAQTIEYFKLPKGAEVSKELMAKYMLQTEVSDFANKVFHDNLCDTCKASASECTESQIDCGSRIIKCNKYES